MTSDWNNKQVEPDIASGTGDGHSTNPGREPRRFSGRRVAAIATGTVIALGAGGIAYAATTDPAPSESTSSPTAPAEVPNETTPDSTPDTDRPDWGRGHHGPGGGPGGHFGFSLGFGMPLHGEEVVESEDGVYETIATQRGTVDELSDDEVTVTSEDGFARTYALSADSLIEELPGELGDIAVGDDVMLVATVDGDTATVTGIADLGELPTMSGGHHDWDFNSPDDATPETTTESSST